VSNSSHSRFTWDGHRYQFTTPSGALDIANWGVDQSRQTQRAELSLRFRKLLAVMRLRSRGSVSKSECGAIINNGSIIQKK
jgi:hypothetical protein